ncbi:MAG TPA: GntG family PLP-dependent aldolase [Actinopolymorphaceae bacterium]
MSGELVDLRSDTVTRPTDGMRQAMARAEVGDDVYGEDPTCRALEDRVAALLGQEAAVFTVTGSLANLLGVRVLAEPGQEVLCESSAHIARAELGAHAAVSGVTFRTWTGERGRIDIDAITGLIAPDAGPYFVSTAAVSVENTHNFGSGAVQSYDALRKLRDLVSAVGVTVHLDGARLWNASVATGVRLEDYGRLADTVSVCLSKGLGAPVGSLVAGDAGAMAEARVWRKRLGGGWRQAGMLAAAGLYALDHHVDRLAEDHANARVLAERLADAVPGTVDPEAVETNIVVLDLRNTGRSAAEVVERARREGVLVGALGPQAVRLVTHLDADTAACRRAADVLCGLL